MVHNLTTECMQKEKLLIREVSAVQNKKCGQRIGTQCTKHKLTTILRNSEKMYYSTLLDKEKIV